MPKRANDKYSWDENTEVHELTCKKEKDWEQIYMKEIWTRSSTCWGEDNINHWRWFDHVRRPAEDPMAVRKVDQIEDSTMTGRGRPNKACWLLLVVLLSYMAEWNELWVECMAFFFFFYFSFWF